MLVSMYMTRDPFTVAPQDDVATAVDLMARHGVRCLPVVGDGHLRGVLSRTDVLRALPERSPFAPESRARQHAGVTVGEIMASQVVTVAPDDSIDSAVSLLDLHKLSCLVVVRGPDVVGVLSRSDILRAFREIVFAPTATRASLFAPANVDVIGSLVAAGALRGLRLRAYAEHPHGDERLVELAVEGERRVADAALDALRAQRCRVLTVRHPVGGTDGLGGLSAATRHRA